MQFRCYDVQTTKFHDVGIETNVRSSAGHIGGDCDSALRSSASDDVGFIRVLPCVQQLMIKATLGKKPAQPFGCFNRARAYEYRPAERMHLSDTIRDSVPFFV